MQTKYQKNFEQYFDYYNKPAWWFKFRYRTVIKDKLCKMLIQHISKHWHEKTIFEIGFGHGNILLSFPTDNRIIGFELSPSAIELAKKRAHKKKFSSFNFYSINNYPIINQRINEADLAIASHVLEHLKDDTSFIKDIYNCLRCDGHFVVLLPVNELFDDPNHERKYNIDYCKKLFEQQKFKIIMKMESDYFFSLIEKVYWRRGNTLKGITFKVLWKVYSLLLGLCPFLYCIFDKISIKFFKAKPHQVGFILKKIC